MTWLLEQKVQRLAMDDCYVLLDEFEDFQLCKNEFDLLRRRHPQNNYRIIQSLHESWL